MTAWRTRQGLESVEDQVSADVGGVVHASKPDLMTRGVDIDLLQMAKRVGPQCEAAEYEDLTGKENLPLDCVIEDDRRSHQALSQRHSGTLNGSTNVGVKTSGSRVGGPELWILEQLVTRDKGHRLYAGSGPLDGGNTLLPA